MKVIESHVCGKRPDPALCEDGFCVTPHFAAVVDGSTSKVEGRSGGRMAMNIVCEALHTLPSDADKSQMLCHLTAALAAHNIPEARLHAELRLTCSAVIYSAMRRTVWMVGDCQWRAAGQTHTNGKWVDEVLTRARCEMAAHLLRTGHTIDELLTGDLSRRCIMDELRQQTNFQNDPNPKNPFRYAVLDGFSVDESLVKEFVLPPSVDELVLASDGYPALSDTLLDTECKLLNTLVIDPFCISENAGTKGWMEGNRSFDDRCYLRLKL